MRGRLIVFLIVLAVWALAGIHHDHHAAIGVQGDAASGHLAGSPAPEPDVPVIGAAVSTSATIQTHVAAQSLRPLRPALSVVTVTAHPPVVPLHTAKPRIFPLLI